VGFRNPFRGTRITTEQGSRRIDTCGRNLENTRTVAQSDFTDRLCSGRGQPRQRCLPVPDGLRSAHPSPYVGILAYMVAPGFLIPRLVLVPIGVWNNRRRRRSTQPGGAARYLRLTSATPANGGPSLFPELSGCIPDDERRWLLPYLRVYRYRAVLRPALSQV
jgi:hypothetical protein